MSDKIEVNRRRVLGGLVTIGAAGAAIGAGTFAYFTDTEESTGNTIETGNLDLSGVNKSGVTLSGLLPGENTDTTTLTATYNGIDGPAFDWGLAIANDTTPSGGDAFSTKVSVKDATLSVDSGNGWTKVNNFATDTDISTLADLARVFENAITDNDGTALSDGDEIRLELQFGLGTGVSGDYADSSVEFGVALHARQNATDPLDQSTITV